MNHLKTSSLLLTLLILSLVSLSSCNSKTDNKPGTEEVAMETSEKGETTDSKETAPPKDLEKSSEKEADFTYGIDLSIYQGDEVGFLDQHKDDLNFIFCKATEGVTYMNPDFRKNWTMIPEKGLIRGAYHFYRTADDPQRQASHYLKVIADLQPNDLPPVIDFEEGGVDQSQSLRFIQSNLLLFLKEIESQSGRKPIIHTDVSTGNKYLDNSRFANYTLWIANYNGNDQPELPNTWKDTGWTFWQKSSSYNINGTQNDFDVFNGSQTQLLNFISKN